VLCGGCHRSHRSLAPRLPIEAFADAILKKMIVEIANNDTPAPGARQRVHQGVLVKGRRGS